MDDSMAEQTTATANWRVTHDRAYVMTMDTLGVLKADDTTVESVARGWESAFTAMSTTVAQLENTIARLTQDVCDLRDRLDTVNDADSWLPEGDMVESIDCDGNPILVDVRGIGVAYAGAG